MKKNFNHKGFTLVELLIVILIIAVLAGMMMMSSDEAATSAKAAKIISNLENVKAAVSAWYIDNRDKIVMETSWSNKSTYQVNRTGTGSDGNGMEIIAGRVMIDNTPYPVQHCSGTTLDIYKYFSDDPDNPRILINETGAAGGKNVATNLHRGSYGLYDAGTPENNKPDKLETVWYVGYAFKEDEDKVCEKIKLRAKTLGMNSENPPYLLFTDVGDPWNRLAMIESNPDKAREEVLLSGKYAVWLKVLEIR